MTANEEISKSKLKIAQIFKAMFEDDQNKEKMIGSILEKEGDINQVIPANVLIDYSQRGLEEYTILLIAAIEKDSRIFQLLLDNGADFTMQNKLQDTVLHYLFDCPSDNKKNELINAVLSAHVRFRNSSNPCNRNGLTHFHIACMVNHAEAVQFFLDNSVSAHEFVNLDSSIFLGYSPLYFAIKGCSIDVIKILLKNHANLNMKDARGRTLLHIFLQQKLKLVESLKENQKEVSNLILEKIDTMDDMTNLFLQSDDIDDVGLSQFHVACTMQDPSVAEYLVQEITDINHHVKFDSPVWPGYTALHFAAHFNMKIFKLLLQKGAIINIKNAEGITPLDIFFRNFTSKGLLAILRSKQEWSNSMFSDGRTKLIKFVNAMCGPLQFLSYLEVAIENVNIFVTENPSFLAGFTPLHFAVLISDNDNIETIQLCLNRGADVSAQDVHGWTPIHLAFHLNKHKITILLLENYHKTVNLIDAEGLSFFHIIQKLTSKLPLASKVFNLSIRMFNDRWNDIFSEFGLSSLHVASYFGDYQLLSRMLCQQGLNVNALISCNDPEIFWSQYYGYTPLHLAVEQSVSEEFVKKLLQCGADMFAARPHGMTPLYTVLTDNSKNHLLHTFFLKLEKSNESQKYLEGFSGITMLHIACGYFNVGLAKDLLEKGSDVNAKAHQNCPIWSGYTPLHVLLKYATHAEYQHIYEEFQSLLGILLERGADVTAVNAEGDTPVHLSFSHCIDDDSFFCMSALMDHHKNFSVNPVNTKNMSHFHAACIVNNVEAVKKFLDYGADVNQLINLFVESFGGQTPLHLALKRSLGSNDHMEVVDLLLSRGANVLTEDSYGYTALHKAASDYSSSTKLFEKLISFGVDVNAKNIFGETPMEFLLKVNEIPLSTMEVMLNSGCRLNSCNHITEEGYLSMIIDEKYHKAPQTRVLEKMIAAIKAPYIDEMSRSAIHNIVTIPKITAHTFNYVDILDHYQTLGIDLDHQDKLGKTALHLASQFGNAEAVVGLINAGAEVNIVDFSGKTALSWALDSPISESDNRIYIVNILVAHIRKLQLLGLHVSQLNEHLLSENQLNGNFDRESLLSEINKLREVVVDTQPRLMLDDFLSETDALASYPFADSKREQIEELLKSVGDKSPEMKGLLMLQYRKALKKSLS